MATIVLVRHGESTWNREGRWQGHADPRLSEDGRAQAEQLAEALVGDEIEAIYSSDLRRAAETAEIIGRRLGLPVIDEPALREADVGSWSGLTRDEIAVRFPGAHRHDGEPAEALAERVLAATRRIAARHPQGCVLIVTHGGPIRAIERAATGESPRVMANCETFRLASEQLD